MFLNLYLVYAIRRGQGGRRRSLVVIGKRPHRLYLVWKVAHLLGLAIVSRADAGSRLAIQHEDRTVIGQIAEDCSCSGLKVVNLNCTDISKNHVHEIFEKTFGYSYEVNPSTYRGPMVVKSTENAAHDGRIVIGPLYELEKNVVYQRVLDNTDGTGLVLDYRVCVIGTEIPFAFKKWRPAQQRFANLATRIEIIEVEACLSLEERASLLAMCHEMGLEFGEIDMIRDRQDGRLYVIDVNKTPCSPPRQFHKFSTIPLMHRAAQAFSYSFLD